MAVSRDGAAHLMRASGPDRCQNNRMQTAFGSYLVRTLRYPVLGNQASYSRWHGTKARNFALFQSSTDWRRFRLTTGTPQFTWSGRPDSMVVGATDNETGVSGV